MEAHFLKRLVQLQSFKDGDYKLALIENFHHMDELLENPVRETNVSNIDVTLSTWLYRKLIHC